MAASEHSWLSVTVGQGAGCSPAGSSWPAAWLSGLEPLPDPFKLQAGLGRTEAAPGAGEALTPESPQGSRSCSGSSSLARSQVRRAGCLEATLPPASPIPLKPASRQLPPAQGLGTLPGVLCLPLNFRSFGWCRVVATDHPTPAYLSTSLLGWFCQA